MTPALAITILTMVTKYGPTVVEDIKQIVLAMHKTKVTVEEIEALFAAVLPPSAYGIPDKAT